MRFFFLLLQCQFIDSESDQLVWCLIIQMSYKLQVGCTAALCQVSVRLSPPPPLPPCSYIINRAYLHTKLSNFNPAALFLYEVTTESH